MKTQITTLKTILFSFLVGISGMANADLIFQPTDTIINGAIIDTKFEKSLGVCTELGWSSTTNCQNANIGEGPSNLVDWTTNKFYTPYGGNNVAVILQTSGAQWFANQIQFATANDMEQRDPTHFILYGANNLNLSNATINLTEFTEIFKSNLALTSDRNKLFDPISFNSNTGYNTFMVVFDAVKQNGNGFQLAEMQLYGKKVPEPSSIAIFGIALLGLAGFRKQKQS